MEAIPEVEEISSIADASVNPRAANYIEKSFSI
jgi:hypothetical protein